MFPSSIFCDIREAEWLVLVFCCKTDPKAASGQHCWTIPTLSLLKVPVERGHFSLGRFAGLPQSLLIPMRAGQVFTCKASKVQPR